MHLKTHGRRCWPWQAVDREGVVLDILVQERPRQEAARTSFRRPVGGPRRRPRVLATDTLAGYPPAAKRLLPATEQRRH